MPRPWVSLLLLGAVHAAPAPSIFGPRDMLQIVSFAESSHPVISPDGEWIAYATTDGADESNILARHPTAFLWVVRTRGGSPRRILPESERAQTPVWSPDGRKLAFLRSQHGNSQLMVWDVASGAIRDLGKPFAQDQSVWPSEGLGPHWTSDGSRLVFAALQPAETPAVKPRVTVIRGVDPVVPGDIFFVDKRTWKLAVVDAKDGQQHYLSDEMFALRSLAVSSDDQTALFRAVSSDTLGRFRAEKNEFWIVSLNGGKPRRVFQAREPAWAAFSSDGREVIFAESGRLHARSIGGGGDRDLMDGFPESTRLPSIPPKSKLLAVLAARPGTGPRDRKMYSILQPVEDVLVVDLSSGKSQKLTSPGLEDEPSGPVWSGDGRTLFYRAVNPATYRETIFQWKPGEPAATPIFSADREIARLSASAEGHALSFTAINATQPEDAYILNAGQREPRATTRLNPQLSSFHFVTPEMFEYRSEDGEPLRALLYKPDGATRDRRVPVVTYVYEKLSPMKNRFNAEAQMHVGNGYAYLMPDVLVNVAHTGESFVKSVVPAVNAVCAIDWVDGKLGITGGSFGGYAGLYLISHVNVFAAAVLRAPPSDFFSTWADGRDRDIWTIETGQARAGGSPWQNPLVYMENSPFFSADRVHTPLLIMHGEKDYTVPTQQGEMMFYALRYLKRPVELVLYREGDHSIVRGSRSDYLDYYQRTLDWWQKYLHGQNGAHSQ
ncbi:MAG: prolyl oligopeptidase family serine peptidase [Bryobacteraceae bacterium]